MNKNSNIIIALYRILKEMDRQTGHIAASHNLTLGQFAVLEALYNKGSLNIGQIKKSILSSDGTIPVIIGNLEKMGLVTRCKDKTDSRCSVVSLTPAGKTLIAKAAPENYKMIDRKFAKWTEEEKELLLLLLNKFREENKNE